MNAHEWLASGLKDEPVKPGSVWSVLEKLGDTSQPTPELTAEQRALPRFVVDETTLASADKLQRAYDAHVEKYGATAAVVVFGRQQFVVSM